MLRSFSFVAALFCLFTLSSLAADTPAAPTTPAGAKGFSGTLDGTVKEVSADGNSVVITVTAATPDAKNKATDANSLVGQDITVEARMKRGTTEANAEDVTKIKALKAGDTTSLKVASGQSGAIHLASASTGTDANKDKKPEHKKHAQ